MWPWRPRPGMVRLSERDLIELLQAALRVDELEQENQALDASVRQIEATLRADEVLRSLTICPAGEQVRGDLLRDVPLTSAGHLHEPALRALYDARLWVTREHELATLITTARGDQK